MTFPQIFETFRAKFSSRAAPRFFQAPGRVNLIGEHTDYNDGFVLPAAIDRQIVLAATSRDDTQINVYALDFGQWDRFDLQKEILPLPENAWGNYVRAMVWSLLGEGCKLRGLDAVIGGNIPIGAGLSSSAALEIAVGFTLLRMSDAKMDRSSLAKAAQKAENDFVGMRCGIMDQFIACLGQVDCALLIDCRDLSYRAVPVPPRASIVIVDSGVHRGLTDMEYNKRRAECESAAAHFGVCVLRDIDMETFQTRAHELSDSMRRRAHHVISENERTLSAAEALRGDDLAIFGKLMIDSHASLRDDFEVSCPELDSLVEIAMQVDGVYGARLTGAGFGGCIVALVEQQATGKLIRAIETNYPSADGRYATAYVCRASEGVSEIKTE
jgi:galactokinase